MARIMRWVNPPDWMPGLEQELLSRPGEWAVIAETTAPGREIERVGLDSDRFEVRAQACDDGEYGVVYEVQARALPLDDR